MVALDLDGTLLRPDGTVGPATRERLHRLSQAGVAVVIATGRSWRTALRVQQVLDAPGPIVSHNGAYAFDTRTGQEIYSRRVPVRAARTMAAWATARGIMLRYYLGFRSPVLFNFFTDEHRASFLRSEDRVEPSLHAALDRSPVEIFLFGTWEVDSFLARFGQEGPGYESLVFPHENELREVNVCAPQVDKVEAVAAVARRLRIAHDDVLAVGDGLNDLRMLKWAGQSAAVGTGLEEARSIAAYVTDPANPEPVVEALDWAERVMGPSMVDPGPARAVPRWS
ncbi:MAG: HAD family hydrolase [Clostridia bacterium]